VSAKRTGWQQTGFRADKDLLNRFRSKLALEGLDMGPVIVSFIARYVEGTADSVVPAERKEEPKSGSEWEIVNEVLEVIRRGGEAADLLRRTSGMLARVVEMEADGRLEIGSHQTHTEDRAGNPVTDERIEEAVLLAAEINGEAEESRRSAPKRPSNAARPDGGRKRVGG
jgi:hypothetical protein